MRDNVTFSVPAHVIGLPSGNFAGYMEHEFVFSPDRRLPFPHLRAEPRLTCCVLRIEREDHPDFFASSDRANIKDVDVTGFVREGRIPYDQRLLPDSVKRKNAAIA